MTKEMYLQILENVMFTLAEDNLQDNDRENADKVGIRWFEQLLSESPHLNPIENVWTDLNKQKLKKN